MEQTSTIVDYYKRGFDWETFALLVAPPPNLDAYIFDSLTGLTKGNTTLFGCRELAFVYNERLEKALAKGVKERHEYFKRHISITETSLAESANGLRQLVLQITPDSIHIGSVFSSTQKINNLTEFNFAYGRELLFDIDISDYHGLRGCHCEEKTLCNACWPFLSTAMLALDYILRSCFQFYHMLWIFSGRRGVHCWVLDSSAMYLAESVRENIYGFFKNLEDSWKNPFSPWSTQTNSYVEKMCWNILFQRCESLVEMQAMNLSSSEALTIITNALNPLNNLDLFNRLTNPMLSSLDRWRQLNDLLLKQHPVIMAKIIFSLLSPRLDPRVTSPVQHLIRAPLSIHNKTFRVVVPLLLKEVDNLDIDLIMVQWPIHCEQIVEFFLPRFRQCLTVRHAFANFLFCRLCFEKRHPGFSALVVGVESLDYDLLFNDNLGAWLQHNQNYHDSESFYPPSVCTLAWLSGFLSTDPETYVENWDYKQVVLEKLEMRFSFAFSPV